MRVSFYILEPDMNLNEISEKMYWFRKYIVCQGICIELKSFKPINCLYTSEEETKASIHDD